MSEIKELKIKASDESMQTVYDFIHSMLPADCDDMLLNQIDLAVEEIFVNIAHYSGADEAVVCCGYHISGDGSGTLTIATWRIPRVRTIPNLQCAAWTPVRR